MKDVTFDFISQITPYTRPRHGPSGCRPDSQEALRHHHRLPDLSSSNEADLITAARVPLSGLQHTRLIGSRLQYVTALASRDLMLNVVSLLGPGAHVLANFSVDRKADNKQRLAEFEESLKLYEVVLRSGGRVMPGGRPDFHFAAKGVRTGRSAHRRAPGSPTAWEPTPVRWTPDLRQAGAASLSSSSHPRRAPRQCPPCASASTSRASRVQFYPYAMGQ